MLTARRSQSKANDLGLLDPNKLYPQQDLILSCPDDGFIIVTGGIGTMKTAGCCFKLLSYVNRYPRARVMVLMQTEVSLSRIFLTSWRSVAHPDSYEIGRGEKEWSIRMANGARILLQYAAHPEAHERIRGDNLTGFYISQGELVKHMELITALEQRTRVPGIPLLRMVDANGGNPARAALQRYVEPESPMYKFENMELAESGDISIYRGHSDDMEPATHIHVRTTPETSVYSRERIDADKRKLPEIEFQRMYEGKNTLDEGLVYKDFDRHIHVRDFDPNPAWRWYRGIDFGYENPFVCLWVGVDHDGCFWVYDELYQSQRTTAEHAEEIKKRHPELHISVTYGDPSAKQNRADLRALIKAPVLKGKNDVAYGISKIRQALRIRDDGNPRLYVHATNCPKTIWEFGVYESEEVKGDKPPSEKPRKVHDHAMDALKYVIATVSR